MPIVQHSEVLTTPSPCWGQWFHDTRTNTLVHASSNYDIPLNSVRTQSDVDRWMCQLCVKRFLSGGDLREAQSTLMAIMEARQ